MLTSCPFCEIAAAHPPVPPSRYLPTTDTASQSLSPPQPTPTPTLNPGEEGHAFLILSTKHILAFLDIMPLTQGHLLVVPRNHYEKLGEVGVLVSRELGTWLPVLSRAVMRTVFGETETEAESTDVDANSSSSALTDPSWNWNVVQNNGAGAAQVVPHVHFHIVPRPPLGAASTGAKMSFIMFGRGQREDLDDGEAERLVAVLRESVAREVVRVREAEGVDLEGEFGGGYWKGKGRL